MEKISKHVSFGEAIKSQTATRKGILNVPEQKVLLAMKLIAEMVFEPLRKHFGEPIGVSSFFRSHALNVDIGGSSRSQHCKGQAMDLDADIFGGMTNKQIFDFIRKNLEFDQLIWEFGTDENPAWVHVSFKDNGNRGQVLRAVKINGRTKYLSL